MSKGTFYCVMGFTGTIPEIADHFGINRSTMYTRLRSGLTLEEIVFAEVTTRKVYTLNGFSGTLPQIAKHFGTNYEHLVYGVKHGLSLQDAVNRGRVQGDTFTINGKTGTLSELADAFNVVRSTVLARLRAGLSLEEALKSGHRKSVTTTNLLTVYGFTGTLPQIAEHFGLGYTTLYTRVQSGLTLEEAIECTRRKCVTTKAVTVKGFTGTLPKIAEHFGINYDYLRHRLKAGMPLNEAVELGIHGCGCVYTINGETGTLRQLATHRFTVDGVTGTLKELCSHFDVPSELMLQRLRSGKSLKNALAKSSTPISIEYTVKGFTGTIPELSRHFNVDASLIYNRLNAGRTVEEAVSPYALCKKGDRLTETNEYPHTVKGVNGRLQDLATFFGVDTHIVSRRRKEGMSLEEALLTPVKRPIPLVTILGFIGTYWEVSLYFDISPASLMDAVRDGEDITEFVKSELAEKESNGGTYDK